jgi:hypothetical protein
MFDGVVESIESDGSTVIKTDLGPILGRGLPGLEVGGKAVAAIHLEDVQLTTDQASTLDRNNVFDGRISLSLFNGPSVNYIVQIGPHTIEVQLGGYDAYANGTDVKVIFPKRFIRVLSENIDEEDSEEDGDVEP